MSVLRTGVATNIYGVSCKAETSRKTFCILFAVLNITPDRPCSPVSTKRND